MRVGVGALTPEQGVYALGRIVAAAVQAIVEPVDWDAFAKSVPRDARRRTKISWTSMRSKTRRGRRGRDHAEDESIAMDVGAIRRVILGGGLMLGGGCGEVGATTR